MTLAPDINHLQYELLPLAVLTEPPALASQAVPKTIVRID